MSCTECGAQDQRGRFCVGCGRSVRRFAVTAAPRPRTPLSDELTQPVLRLDRPSRPAVPTR
ncbi:hypothetical protein GCU56_03725 [Geodermatophilus sabuli]|uniref:Zinc ribbon domain-containing protein n=1 Tax=Geodermatophilus sabuli TaxID=1564158 RepID=A0A7K3VWF9_9ACTN|nr:hypothetical protein [Geodermatophilus sabuli]NEK56981.1 hypothetical protein [Geodermatophilus sabuli]